MKARYYDHNIGRFLSNDPVGFTTDNPMMFNRYAYAYDNPYKYNDPDGELGKLVVSVGKIIFKGGKAKGDFKTATIDEVVGIVEDFSTLVDGRIGWDDLGAITDIALGTDFSSKKSKVAKNADTLQPGPFAKQSIPARGPERNFTKAEREKINKAGQEDGCHTCGSREAGTKSGNHIPDHQPANALNPPGGAQRLYPHCKSCSARQAGQVTQEKRRRSQ